MRAMRRAATLGSAVVSLLLVSCSETAAPSFEPPDPTEPPPAPVVAQVLVTSFAPEVIRGDSVQLFALLLDPSGAIITGRAVEWLSLD